MPDELHRPEPDQLLRGCALALEFSGELLSVWRDANPPQLVHAPARVRAFAEADEVAYEVAACIRLATRQPFQRKIDELDQSFGDYYVDSASCLDDSNFYLVRFKKMPFPFELHHLPRSPQVSRLEYLIVRNVIHALLTPLELAEGLTGQMEDNLLHEDGHDVLRRQREALDSIRTHITDIANAASLRNFEARSFTPQDFSLLETLFSVSSKVKRSIAEKSRQLDFQLDHPENLDTRPVQGYPELLEQLLLHLLENAIKFTPDGGEIHLKVTPEGDRSARFEVADTGPGIDPLVHKLIFRPFVLGDMANPQSCNGLGLGLSAALDCLAILSDDPKAAIAVQSALGEGTRFSFDVPLRPARSEVPAAPTDTFQLPRDPEEYCILIAEDNPTQQLIISRLMERLRYQSQIVGNGVEAVGEYVRGDRHYDLILMDIQMPGISGIQASRMIREHESRMDLPRVPIVAVTANVEEEVHSQCLMAGMDGHHGKPVRPLVLDELIRKALLGMAF